MPDISPPSVHSNTLGLAILAAPFKWSDYLQAATGSASKQHQQPKVVCYAPNR
jgi:hypothetical protein